MALMSELYQVAMCRPANSLHADLLHYSMLNVALSRPVLFTYWNMTSNAFGLERRVLTDLAVCRNMPLTHLLCHA